MNPPGENHQQHVDLEGALRRLGGDIDLFKEFVLIFQEDSPGLMKKIKESIATADASALEKHSHSLKGLISNFGAKDGVEAALRLERAGRVADLSAADEDFQTLQEIYEGLGDELDSLVD